MRRLVDARREVLAAMEALPEEAVPLDDALGLALARDVVSPHDVPPFANSGVDGFAVRSADTRTTPVSLEIVEDVPAGTMPKRRVEEGTATRIMTGAPVPGGADAIVMVEDTETIDRTVVVHATASPGDHVRPAGGDLPIGAVVFYAGERLTPAHLGVLASIGVSAPVVHRRPTVAVLSTGDELAAADGPAPGPGRIRDSNRPMLVALLGELGAEVVDMGIIPDDESRLRTALEEAAAVADAVVTTGGVSMGVHDLVKAVLTDLGRVEFWQVAMQPAKPFAFGFIGAAPLFGLPGNPVSATVGFEQFVRPALLRRMGASRLFRPRSTGTLAERVSTNPDKTVFLRMTVRPGPAGPLAAPIGGQGSNMLSGLAAADAFGVVPVGVGALDAGDPITLEWFRSPESRTAEEAADE
jgi:molybdopterin molybdotransferase